MGQAFFKPDLGGMRPRSGLKFGPMIIIMINNNIIHTLKT